MALSKAKANFYLDMFNTPREDHETLDFVPYCEKFTAGDSYALIRKESIINLLDLNYDGYHPWTDTITKKAVKAKSSSRNISLLDNKFVIANDELKENSKLILKLMTNRHCLLAAFRREIAFILDEESQLVTYVIYRYMADVDLAPPLTTPTRLLPSCAQKIKTALEHRKTNEARKFLSKDGLDVTSRKLVSLSRTVPSHVKSNVGKKSPTDYHKILDRYISRPFQDEVINKPDIVPDENGNLLLEVCFGYTNAFRTFVSSLSPIEDLEYYRKTVSTIETAKKEEAQRIFNSFLGSVNASGSIPSIGSCISIDTTYSVSAAEFLTVAIGIADDFVNAKSSKCSSILLAGMIHTSKTKEVHKKFSDFLNTMFLKIDPKKKKTVGTLLVDGEEAFQYYAKGPYLSHVQTLRCDRHRLDNIKNVCSSTEEFAAIQNALYGEKEKTPTGTVLKESVLQVLNRDDFTERLFRLLNAPFVSSPAKEWFLTNSNSLFERNSLIYKLRGGWPVQYLTTNVIEAKNNWLKTIIPYKKPGECVLDDLLSFHRMEIKHRFDAMIGLESPLTCLMKKTTSEWKKMKIFERRNFLDISGLGFLVSDTAFDNFPSWLIDEIPNKDSYTQALEELEFFEAEGGTVFFLFSPKDNETTKVFTDGCEINCSNKYCLKSSLKTPVCVHKIKVLQRFSEEKKKIFFEKIEADKRGITYMQLMRDQIKPWNGSKFSKRKGKCFSSNNESRAIDRLSSSFEGVVRFTGNVSFS